MSGRTFTDLQGLPPQFEVRSEAEKWQGAFRAAQGAVREQGEVMSAALTNNRSLWETNKRLRSLNAQALATAARMEHERNELQKKLDAIPQDVIERAALQAENEELKKRNAFLSHALASSMIPELDTDQRRAELDRVRKQEAELHATGLVPTAEEIAREDHARDEQRGPFQLDPGAVRAT